MNITRIVAASGAGVLAIAAVFAARPKSNITTVFYTNANVCTGHSFTVGASAKFTTGGAGLQATIKTTGGARKTLWATCISGVPSTPVHFHNL